LCRVYNGISYHGTSWFHEPRQSKCKAANPPLSVAKQNEAKNAEEKERGNMREILTHRQELKSVSVSGMKESY
jgi:hypothetical protein